MRALLAFEEFEENMNIETTPPSVSDDELLYIRFLIPLSEMISWVADQSIVRRHMATSDSQDEYMY